MTLPRAISLMSKLAQTIYTHENSVLHFGDDIENFNRAKEN